MSLFIVILIGFILGLSVPFAAGRFGKFVASDPGTALIRVWHRPRFPKGYTEKRYITWRIKWLKLWAHAISWAVGMAVLFGTIFYNLPFENAVWFMVLFYILALLALVDHMFYILPDVLTLPLLLLGFAFAYTSGMISMEMSLFGAFYGYLLPTVAVLTMHPFKKNSFGFGDVKLLTALGAWFGVIPLIYILLVATISFICRAAAMKRKANAFGPDLAIGALIVFFFTYFYG